MNCTSFDRYYDAQIRDLEKTFGSATATPSSSSAKDLTPPSSEASVDEGDMSMPPPPIPAMRMKQKDMYADTTSTDATPIATPDTSRPNSPAVNNIIVGAKGGPKGSRRARKAANAAFSSSAPASSGDESGSGIKGGMGRPKMAAKGGSVKKMRKWDASGYADEDDGANLDYSAPTPSGEEDSRPVSSAGLDESGSTREWGSRTEKGEYVLRDIGEEMDAILSADAAKKDKQEASAAAVASSGLVGQGLGKLGGLFRNVVGGKTLTKEDLEKPLKGVEEHLIRKNVAREAAVRLCNSVEQDLVGMKTSSFTSACCQFPSSFAATDNRVIQASNPPSAPPSKKPSPESSPPPRPPISSAKSAPSTAPNNAPT